MLRDEGPPVSLSTIQDARRSLAREYGHRVVEERGRKVLIVRCPGAKPDYLHELAEVALHVPLDEVKNVKDVLLVGTEKCVRVEPVALRDRIREQQKRDEETVDDVRGRLRREHGVTVTHPPHDTSVNVLAVRVPRRSIADITPEDVLHARDAASHVRNADAATVAYLVADADHERLTGRDLAAFLGRADADAEDAPEEPAESNPMKQAAMRSAGADVEEEPPAPTAPPAPVHAPSPEAQYADGPAPTRPVDVVESNDEFEIMVSRKPTPPVALPRSPTSEAPAVRSRPVEEADDEDAPPETVDLGGPTGDNGATWEPAVVAGVDAIGVLHASLEADGYEVMAGVDVMGHTFDLAAHKLEGKRILVKRHAKIARETLEEMRRVATDLGADVCVCISDDIEAGIRLASWGTVVRIMTNAEAAEASL